MGANWAWAPPKAADEDNLFATAGAATKDEVAIATVAAIVIACGNKEECMKLKSKKEWYCTKFWWSKAAEMFCSAMRV